MTLSNWSAGLKRHAGVFFQTWQVRHTLDNQNKRLNHELEFLPAALEIQESPPPPTGRAVLWSIVAFFLLAILWALIGKVDIVATAHGKIIPSGHTKVIQPFEIGVVRGIHVHEGQEVKQGDLLIELDSTSSNADRDRLAQQIMTLKLIQARLDAQQAAVGASEHDDAMAPRINAPEGAKTAAVEAEQRILDTQMAEFRAKLGALDSAIARRQSEIEAIRAIVIKLKTTLPLITKRANSLKKLNERKLVSEHDYLELEEERIEKQQDLIAQQNRLKEAQAAITEARQQREAVKAEFKRNTLSELADTEQRLDAISQEYIKATQRSTLQQLTAPVDGVVQQLAMHTVGGVVTPAQELMVIVPKERELEVEAWLENKDIGFVYPGQIAEIKVETFPFTKYGTIDAEIKSVSNDAVADEKRGLIYAARVLMKQSVMKVEEKLVNLSPGMVVTVEVKTGQRRLIEFFMSPLLRYKQESIRER